jgi:hypothetical protein
MDLCPWFPGEKICSSVGWMGGIQKVEVTTRTTVTMVRCQLRAAVLDSDGKKIDEWELDNRVCDCCQTTAAMTEEGPVVIFRDRSETEIRDLGIAKFENGNWKETAPVYMDLWEIAACPVNGPRVSTLNNQVVLAWYSAAKDNPEVKVSFSNNNGKSFEIPTKIDLGQTLGRVDIEMIAQDKAMVCWMEEGKILVRSVDSSGRLGNPIKVATSSNKRSSGFPQMTKNGNTLWFAWTDDSEEPEKNQSSQNGNLIVPFGSGDYAQEHFHFPFKVDYF